VLDPQDARVVADMFGADDEQVARDHLLSHLLAALSQAASEQVVSSAERHSGGRTSSMADCQRISTCCRTSSPSTSTTEVIALPSSIG
jgi:hypothetical protein